MSTPLIVFSMNFSIMFTDIGQICGQPLLNSWSRSTLIQVN